MTTNVHPAETAKFDRLAARWWDPEGESRPLHDLNPVRLGYIADRTNLKGAHALDVGCGGGILSESLARAGANVIAIDLAPAVLDIARLHLHESGVAVDYRETSVEALAAGMPAAFDVIACMEMLEHVPDPGSVIRACATLLKLAFGAAILGAEHVLKLLPRGTHHYEQFLKPSEIAAELRASGLVLEDVSGIAYNPFSRKASLTSSTAVNYLAHAKKPA
jgi:2-polyprenyl-6-hydroxyphenyl methylase/3-demethylubiquinone-9 3-methyltransferase